MTSISAKIKKLLEEDIAASAQKPSTNEFMSPQTYAQLRELARAYMKHERPGHTLQATAIVNEAYMRMQRSQIAVADRIHFFRLAAQAMRNILVDHARARRGTKRDMPSAETIELHRFQSGIPMLDELQLDLIDIDRALNELAKENQRVADIIEQHYFVGQTEEEIAQMFGISESTVTRDMRFGRAWIGMFCSRTKPETLTRRRAAI